MNEKINRGIIQICTGNGKGKTTAALGEAMRASGQGMKVIFIQFLKGEEVGEHFFASKYHPFEIIQLDSGSSFTKSDEELGKESQKTLAYTEEQMLNGDYDIIILDEVFVATSRGFITIQQVLDFLDKKPESVNLVLTGRNAPVEIVQRADLVTEMLNIKHPFDQGITAIRGIDY
ncbi:cob(I)yrinic acid a,c-diamide adenosyltransferase [Chloroflexota bacterium]